MSEGTYITTMLAIRLQEMGTRFTAIIVTAFPLMVLGVLAFAIMEHVISRDRIIQLIPKQSWLAIPLAAILGVVLPVCDCGVVPTSRALLRREFGIAPALAFLIGAPVINPIVFVTTAIGFGFNYTIAITRLILTFVVATGVSFLALIAFKDDQLESLILARQEKTLTVTRRASSRRARRQRRIAAVRLHSTTPLPPQLQAISSIVAAAGDELLDLGRFLILGALVAAAVQTFVPQSPLLSISQNVILSTVALMALASILSICSISDAPVAASFLGTFSPGAVFAFMIFGQIIDLKNGAMLLATFHRSVVIFFVAASALIVMVLGTLINMGIF